MTEIKEASQTQQISVAAWYALTKDGIDLPIRIQLYGHSMHPLIRYRQDQVTIRACSRPLRKGDIVLFQRSDNRYVVHRVQSLTDTAVQTIGDNCSAPDAPIAPEMVLGLVTHVHRGNRTLHVDTRRWRTLGRIWIALQPLRITTRRVLGPVKRAIRNCFRR